MNPKKIFLSLCLFSLCTFSLQAEELLNIPYKNIKENSKITYDSDKDFWSKDVKRRNKDYFVKILSGGALGYWSPQGDFLFESGCEYEFIEKGRFIGYSNNDLKFYDIAYVDKKLMKQELSPEEIQQLFPDYKIIRISEFSKNTNSLKIKKDKLAYKVLLLNDTEGGFEGYSFYTNNSKVRKYKLLGFLDIEKRGMIQFSSQNGHSEENPSFIILVR